jgi:hypothetical protein
MDRHSPIGASLGEQSEHIPLGMFAVFAMRLVRPNMANIVRIVRIVRLPIRAGGTGIMSKGVWKWTMIRLNASCA